MNDKQYPYRFEILKHFKRKRYIENGLTIPFLIGARVIVEPEKELLSITEFFKEVNSISTPIMMMKCSDINEYIFGILDGQTNIYRQHFKNEYKEYQNIIITDNSVNEMSDFVEVINMLENLYDENIQMGNYSKVNGEWRKFTEENKFQLLEVAI